MSKQHSPLELFREFQLRFREVELKPLGFNKHGGNACFHFVVDRGAPYRLYGPHSSIDLKEAGSTVSCTFDFADECDPYLQMMDAAWEAICAGPLAERTFFVDPKDPEEVERFFQRRPSARAFLPPRPSIGIELSHDGDPISGLDLACMSTDQICFFIPEYTSEYRAIVAALELECRQWQKEDFDKTGGARQLEKEIAESEERLKRVLAEAG